MSTALSIIEASSPGSDIAFRKELTIINNIVAECDKEIALMHEVHDYVYGDDRYQMINRLLELNHQPDCNARPGSTLSKVNLQHVKENIHARYWQRVTEMTNVLMIMPAARREEWREQFIYGKMEVSEERKTGMFKDTYRAKKYVGVPEFTLNTVVPTMVSLLNDRHKYLVERVHGLFKALSPNHKTNKVFGFSEKMIISYVFTDYWNDSVSINHRKEDVLDDLRVMLHFFAHQEITEVAPSRHVFSALYRDNKEMNTWYSIDGNLMRVKMFKNGNLHIQVHPDVAWKLNEVLAVAMPASIPSELRKPPAKSAPPKEFGHVHTEVSSQARRALSTMSNRYGSWSYSHHGLSKSEIEKADAVIKRIGGVQTSSHCFKFPYEPGNIISMIMATGQIPDVVAHQFYPTPKTIADYVAAALNMKPGETLLEPSAGRGDLLASVPLANEFATCVEVAPLFAEILKEKGYQDVHNADFMAWSKDYAQMKFDKIAMNPPYSEGRAKAHTLTALEHLNVGGRLVAVLPGVPNLTEWIDERRFACAIGKTFEREFEDTGVTVTVCIFKRIS
ncbi:DUF4942 domain-containing protein [Enterobacter sp. CP102]|uniref:DUF4942 domain-containing protein n=1 Tax=Enterobacter sp. CP102 TaxID=2976431 RepID=UPI002208D6A2|nr:DUF4942 domain-containing protein [Enterobacter sp. CP102]UWM66623.1 DUF4942 domain-containing protein [Enterobacter sp. CP102]